MVDVIGPTKPSFGPGWPERNGDDMWELAEELGGTMAHRLRNTALLRPEDSRWGLEVERHGDLLARIGVTNGLRLSPVNDIRFFMQISDYKLPRDAPAGVDQKAWDGWRAAARQEARPRPPEPVRVLARGCLPAA